MKSESSSSQKEFKIQKDIKNFRKVFQQAPAIEVITAQTQNPAQYQVQYHNSVEVLMIYQV